MLPVDSSFICSVCVYRNTDQAWQHVARHVFRADGGADGQRRLDPHRPQRQALWQHPQLPAGRVCALARHEAGTSRASGETMLTRLLMRLSVICFFMVDYRSCSIDLRINFHILIIGSLYPLLLFSMDWSMKASGLLHSEPHAGVVSVFRRFIFPTVLFQGNLWIKPIN